MSVARIAEGLRADILEGRLLPGTDLQQSDLALRFGTSRIPVRDALNLLASERLVELRPNRTARVVSLSAAELDEIFDLRLLLETDALARALPRLAAPDLAGIAQELRRCEVEAGLPSFPEADWRFHRALYAAAGREIELALIRDLRRLCQLHLACYPALRRDADRWSADHRRLLAAVEAGDARTAAATLDDHLRGAAAALRGAMAGR
ncbi:MAG: GntR family transcriptional regulator [Defluviimonas sp.]|uniref:GntR family transcriptional regulator n=1 Tax=Albidovulum sp. TaxID=1872424 RepID=UPI001DC3EBE5|nr:GntR family transcriptional regulator [Paracoccaceae bacterium]MCC0065276.1 GntR family transcriptional regulator [Defluviimonas sp.]